VIELQVNLWQNGLSPIISRAAGLENSSTVLQKAFSAASPDESSPSSLTGLFMCVPPGLLAWVPDNPGRKISVIPGTEKQL
jgi:hypothetical protein